METILVVDDEKNYLRVLSAVLEDEDYEVLTAQSGQEALEILKSSDLDLILTDMKMPAMNGIELLEKIKVMDPDLPVIMMTAHGTIDKAVEAMQKGAYSYILKPFDNERLILYVKKAVAMYQVVKENRRLRDAVESQYRFGNFIGKSKPVRDVFEMIRKVAPSNVTVLVEGESGTGKELVAKSIHFNSSRRDKPFIAVNCSALVENLLESELFGHEKGAFTGAVAKKKGRFELADGGTLFLDEIGELSPNIQVKLLRVLQEKTFERVGGTRPIVADIRVIAATNKNLKEEIEKENFREDLFHRLNVIPIKIPPLRERLEDIPILIEHFVGDITKKHKKGPVNFKSDAIQFLKSLNWSGNIREPRNIVERIIIIVDKSEIDKKDIEFLFAPGQASMDEIIDGSNSFQEFKEKAERVFILKQLNINNWNISKTAEMLEIQRSHLYNKMKKYEIEKGE